MAPVNMKHVVNDFMTSYSGKEITSLSVVSVIHSVVDKLYTHLFCFVLYVFAVRGGIQIAVDCANTTSHISDTIELW